MDFQQGWQSVPVVPALPAQPEQDPAQLQVPAQVPQLHPPLLRTRMICRTASTAAARSMKMMTRSQKFMDNHPIPTARQMSLARRPTAQAITHCQMTTPTAHFLPSSRRIEAMAATHGV